MRKSFTVKILLLFLVLSTTSNLWAQSITINGQVVEERSGAPLIGVNVVVKGKVVGTITDQGGNFTLELDGSFPVTLVFSFVGYQSIEKEVTSGNAGNLKVSMNDQVMLGNEVVVSASRTEENIMKSPVSIEKMNILDIRNTPSDDYYKAIASLRGVDVSSSSINFQILNTRGFGSTGNERFVQLTDMMDTQAPALNFPIGNLNGPSLLDVESIELIPGAASALYGANAFNGILLVTSKNPFEYQGLQPFLAKLLGCPSAAYACPYHNRVVGALGKEQREARERCWEEQLRPAMKALVVGGGRLDIPQPLDVIQNLIEAGPLDELHHVVVQRILHPDPEDRDNVRMVQPGGRLRFPLEPQFELCIRREVSRKDLDRHLPSDRWLHGPPDDRDRSGADAVEEAVAAQGDADVGRVELGVAVEQAAFQVGERR